LQASLRQREVKTFSLNEVLEFLFRFYESKKPSKKALKMMNFDNLITEMSEDP
jgi:hypothetical protein